MTETLTDPAPVRPGGGPAPEGTDGGDTAALHRSRAWRRRRNAVRWFSALTVVAVVGVGYLGYQGYQSFKQLKGGAVTEVITDPAAPGYIASVDPTAVHLLALTDAEDDLSAFVALVPGADGGGTVVWSLGELIVEVDGKEVSLSGIYRAQGVAAARAEFEKVLGFGVSDVVVVGPDQFETLMAPVDTVTVKNADPVLVEQKGKRVTLFESGELEFDAAELHQYLTVRAAGEAPENRATRASAGLGALMSALADGASGGTAGTPLVSDAGADVAEVLATVGNGASDFVVLPMERQAFKGSFLYRPDAPSIADELADVVQFPVSSYPGQRPRVRILNGTTDVTRAKAVAPALARLGGEVLVVGNADPLDVTATTVTYGDPAFEAVAARIAGEVGVTAQLSEDQSDAADIDVVLGADYSP